MADDSASALDTDVGVIGDTSTGEGGGTDTSASALDKDIAVVGDSSTPKTSTAIDPGAGTGGGFDWTSLAGKGVQAAEDLAKAGIQAAEGNKPGTPKQPGNLGIVPPGMLQPGKVQPTAMSTGTKTALIVGGVVVGGGLLVTIAVLASRGKRHRPMPGI